MLRESDRGQRVWRVIVIGDGVLIAANVQLLTADHASTWPPPEGRGVRAPIRIGAGA
jgi:hypothetical protein